MTFSETLKTNRIMLTLTGLLTVGVYYPVIQRMVLQWYQDGNYSHGFLVPLISAYLLYERRKQLGTTEVSPWKPGIVVIVLGLLQLILGFLATEYFTMRSSLIVLLAGLVLYLFGRAIFRQTLLPTCYLIMMVPLPYMVYDFLAFPLKLFVTKVSVGFLHMVGVVALREGNIIMFPSTTLEVADACSGMRSLMSLFALAIAFAFLMRTSPLRRFVMILSAIPVAIFTNALRVVVTGILAQIWGARVAEGFFHEFAGLTVFVLAMAILAGIGALLRDKNSGRNAPEIESVPPPSSRFPMPSLKNRFILIWILVALAGSYKAFHADLMLPLNSPFNNFPTTVQGWRVVSQDTFSDQILKVLKPTDYLSRTYADTNGDRVELYIGYHGGGNKGGEIHSPKHCLPGSGWHMLSTRQSGIDCEQGRLNLVKAVYKQGDRTILLYYWFQVQDRSISDEYSLKLAQVVNSVLHNRRDSSFIRITVPATPDVKHANDIAERFIKDFSPVIGTFLPR